MLGFGSSKSSASEPCVAESIYDECVDGRWLIRCVMLRFTITNIHVEVVEPSAKKGLAEAEPDRGSE
jgi:hypothetical protein